MARCSEAVHEYAETQLKRHKRVVCEPWERCGVLLYLSCRLAVQSEDLTQLLLTNGLGFVDLVAEDQDGHVPNGFVCHERLLFTSNTTNTGTVSRETADTSQTPALNQKTCVSCGAATKHYNKSNRQRIWLSINRVCALKTSSSPDDTQQWIMRLYVENSRGHEPSGQLHSLQHTDSRDSGADWCVRDVSSSAHNLYFTVISLSINVRNIY